MFTRPLQPVVVFRARRRHDTKKSSVFTVSLHDLLPGVRETSLVLTSFVFFTATLIRLFVDVSHRTRQDDER